MMLLLCIACIWHIAKICPQRKTRWPAGHGAHRVSRIGTHLGPKGSALSGAQPKVWSCKDPGNSAGAADQPGPGSGMVGETRLAVEVGGKKGYHSRIFPLPPGRTGRPP